MYKISLIIPTRERPTLFQKVIESLQINTKHPENLELLTRNHPGAHSDETTLLFELAKLKQRLDIWLI